MKKTFPREHIAAEISDLRQMRGALADIISTACGLLGQAKAAGVSDSVGLELMAALSHAEKADFIAKERMFALYNQPTPEAANVNEAAA